MKRFVFFGLIVLLLVSSVSALSLGNMFDFFTGKVVSNLAPSVTLSRPSENEVVNNPVTFTWRYSDPEDDPLSHSVLQIDDNRKFFSPTNYLVDGTSFKMSLDEDGEYFWRVQVVNEFGSKLSEANRLFLNSDEKICSDGTAFFECSIDKPFYCDSGALRNDCQRCGCDASGICQPDGSCLTQKCSDGTIFGVCNTVNKPVYCFQGDLRDVCSICGCPGGLECTASGECVEKEEIIVVEPFDEEPGEEAELSAWGKFISFWRWLFLNEPLYK